MAAKKLTTTLNTPYSLAALSSLLLFLASPGRFSWGPLAWVALAPLIMATAQMRPAKAARLGLFCGAIYYCSILYWIVIVLGRYGGLPLWVSGPALVLLALYMGLFLALFSAGLAWGRHRLPLFWLGPSLWVGLDFLRGHLFTGFPWLDLGYSQYQYPQIIQLADLTGHYGVTFMTVLTNCLVVSLCHYYRDNSTNIRRLALRELLPTTILIVAAASYNFWRMPYIDNLVSEQPTINVGVVQGNIDQSVKWSPTGQTATVDKYLALSDKLIAKKDPNLLIWPETALPFFPLQHPLFSRVTERVIKPGGPVFISGAPHYISSAHGQEAEYFNSAFILTPDTENLEINENFAAPPFSLSRYDKQHLVPFGEYIPFSNWLPSSMPIVHSMGNFSAGLSTEPFSCHNANIGVLICYESIFPDLARKEVGSGATLLINITNDAWYGNSSAPWQQLAMVVFRAVENRKSFARAANTGISCFIDPLGRQLQLSPLFKPYSMAATLPVMEGPTHFTSYGHYFPLLCLLSLVIMITITYLSSRTPSAHDRTP